MKLPPLFNKRNKLEVVSGQLFWDTGFFQDKEVLVSGKTHTYEDRVNIEGNWRTLLTTKYVYRNIDGTNLGIVGISRDITDRKLVEEELHRSHTLYQQAEQMGQLSHWEWDDVSDRMTHCSEQLAQILDMTVDEVLARCTSYEEHLKLIHEDDRERYRLAELEAERQQETKDIEYRVVTGAGAVRHVHEICVPELDEEGNLFRSFGTLQDITVRYEAEEALHRSESKFRSLFEFSQDGIVFTSIDGNIENANPAFCKMVGHTKRS